MSSRPRFQQSYMDPRTVPLTPKMIEVLPDPSPDPEQALLQSPPRHLKFTALKPTDHLAVELWLSGLTQVEIGRFLGTSQPRVVFRLTRAMADLKLAGIGHKAETI